MYSNLDIKLMLYQEHGTFKDTELIKIRIVSAHIYVLVDPRSKEIRYVGKAFDVEKRHRQHCRNSNYEKSHKWNWILSLKSEGLAPELDILETFPDEPSVDWQEAERFWISYLSFLGMRLTNLDSGGIGGKRISIETRKKLSSWQIGRKFTLEQRAKMSAAKKGMRLSPAHRAAIGRSLMGTVFSQERRQRIAASKKGIKRKPETVTKIKATKLRKRAEAESLPSRPSVGKSSSPTSLMASS